MTAATPHFRALLIALALAATAAALGFYTIARQQSDPAPVSVPVHHMPHATKGPRVNANVAAALAAGLPKHVAAEFATHRVVVVTLYAPSVATDRLAAGEARAGALAGHAAFVAVNVARGGASDRLAQAFGLVNAPATLVLERGGYTTPKTTLDGFADRETVEQAVRNTR